MILGEAAPELVVLAEYLQIPVTPTLMGKGTIPEDHPLYAAIVGIQTQQRFANQIFLEADCILAIGARFGDRHTGQLDVYRGARTFIHIDIEPTQIGRVFEPDLGIVGHARLARPERLVVGVVGDYSFQFTMEEVAIAAQYQVPFVLVMLNNNYLGLIREAELPYDMNYAVDISFADPAGGEGGIDHVKAMEAMGGLGRRVSEPGEIRAALAWAVQAAEAQRVPVLVEIMTERETNAAMGAAINAIREWEPVEDVPYEQPALVPA